MGICPLKGISKVSLTFHSTDVTIKVWKTLEEGFLKVLLLGSFISVQKLPAMVKDSRSSFWCICLTGLSKPRNLGRTKPHSYKVLEAFGDARKDALSFGARRFAIPP